MRHFEQIVLVEETSGKTIIERRYSDGVTEYRSAINVQFQNGTHKGQATIPFKIDIGPSASDPRAAQRAAAFANFEDSLNAARPGAEEQVRQQYEKAQRREQSKILLAGALPPLPAH